jgi:GTP cyclohydrolase IA
VGAEDFAPDLIRRFLRCYGIDPDRREGTKETPARVAAAWEFWLSGYKQDPLAILKTFEDGAERADEMVFQGAIPFFSSCEHHLAGIFGIAHVGYIPKGRIVGLSKVGRVIDVFSRRLQVQERLTQQIADCLWKGLEPIGVGVVLQGRHLCLESRGICKVGSVTTTSALIGALKEKPEARAEFMAMVTMAAERGSDVL